MLFLFLPALLPALMAQSPAELSSAARQAMEARRYREAAALYDKLAASLPSGRDRAGFRMNAGLARFQAGDFEGARDTLTQALEADPKLAAASLLLGMTERKLGQPDAALDPLRQAVAAMPGHALARLELADTCLALGRNLDAAREFQKLTAAAPEDPRAFYGLAVSAEAAAADSLRDLDQTAPESSWRDALDARLRYEAAQYRAAFRLYRQAGTKQPPVPGIAEWIAEVYRASGHAAWAAAERRKLRAPTAAECKASPVACAVRRGSYRAAIASTATGGASVYWRALALLGTARKAGRALEALPPSVESHRYRAERFRLAARFPDAAAELQRAAALDPRHAAVRRELAQALWLARDYSAALPLLRELASAKNASAAEMFWLGDTLANLGEDAEAGTYLLNAIERDRNQLPAFAVLGRIFLAAGKLDEAISAFERALPSDEDGSLHVQLARALQQASQPDKSRGVLERRQELLDSRAGAAPEITAPE